MGGPKNPKDNLSILQQEINRLFRDLLPHETKRDQVDSPVMDILEAGGALKIEIEVPGLCKDDISLSICGDNLIVEGTKRDSERAERINYICMERRFGHFRRTIELPGGGDSSNITATHKNGVLTITLPKISDRRGLVRRIDING